MKKLLRILVLGLLLGALASCDYLKRKECKKYSEKYAEIVQRMMFKSCMKKQKKMKKLLGILFISLLWCGTSFAMSSTYEKAYYDTCYPQIKKLSNPTRAKQYCTCTMKMMSKRYSDKDMDQFPKKSYAEREKLTQFAADHCNANANAF